MVVRRTVQMGRRFWQQTQRDLESGRRLLEPGTSYAAAQFAHQAAEKALKAAIWHVRAEEPPWRHDLVACAGLIAERVGPLPPEVYIAVVKLEPIFEESRYPSGDINEPIPAELIGETDARKAVAFAEEVLRWVESLLQQPPGRVRR